MISKKTLKMYCCETIEDYFNYVIDSYVNGNHAQFKGLFKSMNKNQRKDFLRYVDDNGFNPHNYYTEIVKFLINNEVLN